MDGMPTVPQLMQLVGNPRNYAVQSADGARYNPVRARLSPLVLRQHLAGDYTVGTYIVDGDKARTLVLDVDSGDDALDDVASLRDALVHHLGVPDENIGVEFSGRKGYHVWVVAAQPVLAHDLRRLGLAARALAGVDCEVYPKQDKVVDLGNLVKLPGGIHRATGVRAHFITPFPLRLTLEAFGQLLDDVPEIHTRNTGPTEIRTYECMARIQDGVDEGGRNNALFHLAVMLRRNGVADEHVTSIVHASNDRSKPPLDTWEVDALLSSSLNQSGPMCAQLPEALRCGENCILNRTPGLYTRAGQVKYAAEGEMVVVQVKSRNGKSVVLQHDDTEEIRATVR